MIEDHEPIIDRATFDAVQKEIRWRAAMFAPAMNGDNEGEKCDSRKPDKPSAPEMDIPMICGICGKRYRRKITRRGTAYAAPVWICSTYNYRGKAYCASKQIPEPILLEMITAALGNRHTEDEVDHLEVCPNNRILFVFQDGHVEEHNIIAERIERIVAMPDKMLAFHLSDGTVKEVKWALPSRSESWTTDMRQKAAEQMRRRHAETSHKAASTGH